MRKITGRLLLPFKYLLLLFSYLFPRNKKIWCFGYAFTSNPKYLFLHMVENRKDIRCIWITDRKNLQSIKSKGYEVYYRWSFKGLWYSLIGGVYLYNSYPNNVNLYTIGRAKRVNLWHGIALKCVDRQIKSGPMTKIYQSKGPLNELRYLNFRLRPDIVLSTSPIVTKQYVDAFGVDERHFIEGVYPRCMLFNENLGAVESFIQKYEGPKSLELVSFIKTFDYTYIYMPTFRDTGDNFIEKCGFDLGKINEVMKTNHRLFIMKLHPDSTFQFEQKYSNVVLIDKDIDIYPLLPFTDCLITDYSSIYCDYILMQGKQTIFFVPDYEEYTSRSRELYYSLDDIIRGKKVRTFDEFVNVLNMEEPHFKVNDIDTIRKMFWDYKIETMDELVDAIKEKING